MGIKLVTFAAQTVTPQDDALIYETALQESGMIYGGVVTIKNANVLHVDAGHGALCGRKFTIEATDVPVPLTASGSLQGRIYIHMDLSDTGEPISFQVETASSLTPVIQQADVNINSGIYEINLATFIVDTSTISNLINVAPFIDIEPDSGFNAQSNNPVQNKVITKAVGVPETIGGLASQEYNIGDTLVSTDGQFYDVIAHISPNATIVLNGNVTLGGNIVDLINSLSSQISNIVKWLNHSQVMTGTPNATYIQSSGNDISMVRAGKMVILTVYLEVKTHPIPAGTTIFTVNNAGALKVNAIGTIAGHGYQNAIKITLARNSSNASNVDIIVGETYNGTTFRGSFAYEVQ